MRVFVIVAAIALSTAAAGSAEAATKKPVQQPVDRTAQGTLIEPTRTVIHNPNGTTTVIIVPRRRSYLDTGTEVSVGDRGFRDYMLPPGGDPGHQDWFFGPDLTGSGGYPLPRPLYIPGFNPATPF